MRRVRSAPTNQKCRDQRQLLRGAQDWRSRGKEGKGELRPISLPRMRKYPGLRNPVGQVQSDAKFADFTRSTDIGVPLPLSSFSLPTLPGFPVLRFQDVLFTNIRGIDVPDHCTTDVLEWDHATDD